MIFFRLFFFLFFFSCAKPHYVDPMDPKKLSPQSAKSCSLYFSQVDLCLQLNWQAYPSEDTLGSFTMSFHTQGDPDHLLDPPFTPFVKLWMPSMSHGSSPVVITKLSPGHYLVSEVYFIMLGEWEIRFQLKQNHEIIQEQIQTITL